LAHAIQSAVGPQIALITPGKACAEKILKAMQQDQMLNKSATDPTYRFFVSANPKKFWRHAQSFFTLPMGKIELAQNKTL
jgi:glutamate racemase